MHFFSEFAKEIHNERNTKGERHAHRPLPRNRNFPLQRDGHRGRMRLSRRGAGVRQRARRKGGQGFRVSPQGVARRLVQQRARRLRRPPRHRLPRNTPLRLVKRLAPHQPGTSGLETGLGHRSKLQRRREEP